MLTDFVLLPALPEIVLAVGSLVLLMIGAFAGERSTSLITTLSVLLLLAALVILLAIPAKDRKSVV